MNQDRPVLGALLWMLVGAILAALLFLVHVLLSHDEADEVDNHAGYEAQN